MKIEEAIEILERKTTIPGDGYTWEQIEEAFSLAITALRSMPEAGEPLTVERLREMDGKPVWIEDLQTYGLVSVENNGTWEGVPFVVFTENGVKFTYNIEERGLKIYAYLPAHIDRSKWTAEWVPMTDDDGCVWLECSACEYDLDSLEEPHPFCPSCGRAMMPEAWAELERRLRMPEPPEEG